MSDAPRPLLRVVRGDATPEEVAALVAVLSARMSAAATVEARSASRYADPSAGHRRSVRVGPGAWVASGWVPGTRTKAEL